MFSLEKPINFDLKTSTPVAGSFLFDERSRILLLQRASGKGDGGKWGLPGGKIDNGETPEEGVIREIREETGFIIASPELLAKLYVKKYDHTHFIYYLFRSNVSSRVDIILNPDEHMYARWVTKERALKHDLIHDLDECIKRWM